ncbi:MAG: DUF1636 domain-containing protein [Pseudomonadota bacterium]
MAQSPKHRISVCISCKHKGRVCKPGYDLIAKLRAAVDTAGPSIPEDFEVSGVACMAGCDRPCTVAYHATRKATYLFGDIEDDTDIEALVAFARQYAHLHDGWNSSVDRPASLRGKTLARVPAAVVVLEESAVPVS